MITTDAGGQPARDARPDATSDGVPGRREPDSQCVRSSSVHLLDQLGT